MDQVLNIDFVIPAYNAENTLEEAVRSIMHGNFNHGDEIIIVDDKSTDRTKSLAESLSTEFSPYIKVISNQENKGCPASRNIGISLGKNLLIFNLDSDNVLTPNSIVKLKEALIEESADVAAFQTYEYFKSNTSEVTHKWICHSGLFTLSDILGGTINPAPGGNFLYRKSFWEKIGGYSEYGKGLHEAWGFSLKLLCNGAKFIVVPDTFYFHRYSHQSLFVRESQKQDESITVTNKFIESSLPLLNTESVIYVRNNPDWFNHLQDKPLITEGGLSGKEGKLVFTSATRQVLHKIKTLVKKILRQ